MSDDDAPLRRQATVMFTAKVAHVGKVIFGPKKKKVQPSFSGLKLMHSAGWQIFNKTQITVATRAIIMIL